MYQERTQKACENIEGMSSRISSSSNSSETDEEDSLEDEIGEFSGFIPYEESLEPIATEQDAVEYNESVAQEAEEEEGLQA